MERILHALRARRLDSVAVAYAVVSWVLVQAADIVLPVFDAPEWTLRALIIFLLTAFPFAIGIAWFAIPHVDAPPVSGRRLTRMHAVLGLFAVIIVLVAGDFAYLLSQSGAATPESASASATEPAKNSIAVLPFANMSGDPANEYFSDGISEELLNDLANTPTLLVAARTSSFAFKGKNESVAKIARILGVHSIVEGSVRANGPHLRITATLIDAADGYTLWSKTYDRDMTDMLIVQSEIARAITSALRQKLVPGVRAPDLPKAQTIDPEAYRAYLLGKRELAPRTQAGAEAALILFQKVTRLAPDFADGFAELARAQMNLAEYKLDRHDLISGAREALAHALRLDPRNLDALSAHLDLSLHGLDWSAAIGDARKMTAINPNSITVQHELFRLYQFLDFPDLALKAARSAVKLNPLSFVDRLNVVAGLWHEGRYADLPAAANAALDLAPDQPDVLLILCAAAARRGDLDAAQSAKAKLVAAGAGTSLQLCEFHIADTTGHRAKAKAITDRLAADFSKGQLSATQLALNYAIIGRDRLAIHWLERAYDRQEFTLFVFPGEKVVPPAFFKDKAWKAFYRRPLFDAWRAAHQRVAAGLSGAG